MPMMFFVMGGLATNQKLTAARFIRTSSESTARRLYQLGLAGNRVLLVKRSLSEWPSRNDFSLIDKRKLKLLSVGRLVEKKVFSHACHRQFAQEIRGSFLLGNCGNGPLRRDLLIERRRLALKEEVSFSGSLNQKSIRQLYLESDAFCLPELLIAGDRDGIPNMVPEALAAGMLVLASNRAGAPEAFIDGKSGYSLAPADYLSWVSILIDFWKFPEKYLNIRKNGQLVARENFDSKVNGCKLLEAYIN